MTQDLHEYVVDELTRAGKEQWPAIAASTGVSLHTIIKVARRTIDSPRYVILKPLVEHFQTSRRRRRPAKVG